jgi:hypothetical protein
MTIEGTPASDRRCWRAWIDVNRLPMLSLPFCQTVEPGLQLGQSRLTFRRKQMGRLPQLVLESLLQLQELVHAFLHTQGAKEPSVFCFYWLPPLS